MARIMTLLGVPGPFRPFAGSSAATGSAQVRFTARSFSVAGDHAGQTSSGHRWPFGPVALITVGARAGGRRPRAVGLRGM